VETLWLSCPHCGFSREILRERIPLSAKNFICPKCQQKSSLAEAVSPAGEIESEHSSQSWKHWEELAANRSKEEDRKQAAQPPDGFTDLLRAGWEIYRDKWWIFSAVYLYMVVLAALPWVAYWQAKTGGLPVAARWQESLLILMLTAGLSSLGMVLGSCTLLQVVVAERIDFGRALRNGFKTFPAYLQVSCWVLFMVLGGGLLLIPGLVFTGLFAFSVFVLLHEKERGLDALCISAQYIRTSLWVNLGKVALLLLLLGAGTLFFAVQIVILPYVLVCLYLLYGAARQQVVGHRSLAGPRFKRYFIWPVVVTYVLALVGLSILAARQTLINGFHVADLRQMAGSVLMDSWKISGVAPPGCGLLLEKSQVNPGEQIKVRLLPSSEISQNYYLCVTGEGEGSEETYLLDQAVQEQRFVVITAPREKGEYQIRIYSDYDRTSAISSMNFQVL